jgi:hypothetical protein
LERSTALTESTLTDARVVEEGRQLLLNKQIAIVLCDEIEMSSERRASESSGKTKRTVPGLRTWSPTVLLTGPDEI